jgi:hypothetical protein
MAIFLRVHLIPTFADLKQRLIGWKGAAFYKIGYSGAVPKKPTPNSPSHVMWLR